MNVCQLPLNIMHYFLTDTLLVTTITTISFLSVNDDELDNLCIKIEVKILYITTGKIVLLCYHTFQNHLTTQEPNVQACRLGQTEAGVQES